MMKFKDYVKIREVEESHPRFKLWRKDIHDNKDRGGHAQVWIERKADMLGFKPAKIVIDLLDKDGVSCRREIDEWDPDLNQALVALGIRASDKDNESVRVNLTLTDALAKVEVRYGDGYFSSVFVDLIKSIDFAEYPAIQKIITFSTALNPDKSSSTYGDCKAMIESILHKEINDLRDKLKYGDDEISEIMAAALVRAQASRCWISSPSKM
jgi:hypothetical protein